MSESLLKVPSFPIHTVIQTVFPFVETVLERLFSNVLQLLSHLP